MRIVCPSCQAAYEVPDKLLSSAARKVRCARCGDAWMPEPIAAPGSVAAPGSIAAPDEAGRPAEPEPETKPAPLVAAVVPRVADRLVEDAAEPPPGRGPAVLAAVAWAASVALLAGAGWAAVAWRAEIMAVWAPSRRLFALLGLA